MSQEKNKISQEGKKADKKMSKRESETNEEKINAKRPKKEKSVNKAKPEIINKIIDKTKMTALEIKSRKFFTLF